MAIMTKELSFKFNLKSFTFKNLLLTRASLVPQTVKHPPAMQETWDQSLGWKTPWIRAWQ